MHRSVISAVGHPQRAAGNPSETRRHGNDACAPSTAPLLLFRNPTSGIDTSLSDRAVSWAVAGAIPAKYSAVNVFRWLRVAMGSVAVLLVLGFCTCTAGYRVQTPPPSRESLNVGLLLPHTNFGVREYTRAINNAVSGLHRSQKQRRIDWLRMYSFSPANVHTDMMKLTPSPTGLFVFSTCLTSECVVFVLRESAARFCLCSWWYRSGLYLYSCFYYIGLCTCAVTRCSKNTIYQT